MASDFGQPRGTEMAYIDNGLYPVPHSDVIVNESASSSQYMPYHGPQKGDYTQITTDGPIRNERRICGVSKAMFILWCVIAFMVALLVVIGGVFGAMLARQESRIQSMESSRGTATESAPAAATTWVNIPDWEYIGCYRDNSQRIFRGARTNFTDSQTNSECKNYCQKDFGYFATETGGECYCSSTPPESKLLSSPWNCNVPCRGNKEGEVCGGAWHMSVWKKSKQ
ncbi:pyrrolo-quinoline quinone [Colletotrichum truncatum]|uniref:Pyrrolo-quinoline quinone n=1 Tax=Colletotrichum truncatum TaxID=5467 RepID=A0ACC3YEW2_COLTU|nr:pyrrolo-quinoline quinone [Colletotrichum truncatum]KAF6783224.1 pyrrolo-quinoline quinone [Colletotrichum truncatum]